MAPRAKKAIIIDPTVEVETVVVATETVADEFTRELMIDRLSQLFKPDVLAIYDDKLLRVLMTQHLGY